MGKLTQTFIVSVLFGFISANPAFAVKSVVEWDFDTEDFSIECLDCSDAMDLIEPDCYLRNQYTDVHSSCTGGISDGSGEAAEVEVWITTQVSADGGPSRDGDVTQYFSYRAPYTLHHSVSIEKSKIKGRPVTYMVFPVVKWWVIYLVHGELEVDGNTGAKGEGAAIWEIVLEPGSRKVIEPYDYSVYTDGREIIAKRYEKVSTWEAPELEAGDSISLDAYNCDNTIPHLQKLCTAEGEKVWFQSSQEFEFGIDGEIKAWSKGAFVQDIPFPIPIDGGEALACFGRNSPLSSFDLECSTNGIVVLIQSHSADSVRYTVRQIGPNQWKVVNIMFDIPTLRHYGLVILALLMLGIGMVGVRRFA